LPDNHGSIYHNRFVTLGVLSLLIALGYYMYKDVSLQIKEIKAESNLQKTFVAHTDENGLQINCPRSRYEGSSAHNQHYYSQRYEDYILNHVFSDEKKGTYIDIGSAGPIKGNLAHHFYLKGWRGINIDPMPSYLDAYKKERPEDLFLNVGISNEAGNLTLYECGSDCMLSTFDKAGAEKLSAEHPKLKFIEIDVPVMTIENVLKKYPQEKVNFVNIDVEGWETQVIQSFDFSLIRPEVFVIESTEPTTDITTQHLWEKYLFKNDYVFAMTDYLNRYYVDKTHKHASLLLQRLNYLDMCVRQSKLLRGIRPTSYHTYLHPKQ